jgi:hypothetical protein
VLVVAVDDDGGQRGTEQRRSSSAIRSELLLHPLGAVPLIRRPSHGIGTPSSPSRSKLLAASQQQQDRPVIIENMSVPDNQAGFLETQSEKPSHYQ